MRNEDFKKSVARTFRIVLMFVSFIFMFAPANCRHARVRIPPAACMNDTAEAESPGCTAAKEQVEQKREAGQLKTVTKNVTFYLWGFMPGPVEVDVSNECPNGVYEVHEYDDPMDALFISITGGIYMPRTVEITCM